MFDTVKAVKYLDLHGGNTSLGRCAEYTRKAIEAGGLTLVRHTFAKDYGSSLTRVGFTALGQIYTGFRAADVVVIQPIPGHPEGHMAMFDGLFWISDFKQLHGLYPGAKYRALRPSYVVYRYATSPVHISNSPSPLTMFA